LAHGSSREQGWFWLGLGRGEIKRVLLTESPIDALSLAVLDKPRKAVDGVSVYLSTDGAGAVPGELLKPILERGDQVMAAFDADAAGEVIAWRIAQELPGVQRLRPAYGKDWNERLMLDGHPERVTPPAWDKQATRILWKWYQTAYELGRSENYLKRITEVARAVVRGQALSERARAAMQQDFQALRKLEQVELG
jgi:hypothetical protein